MPTARPNRQWLALALDQQSRDVDGVCATDLFRQFHVPERVTLADQIGVEVTAGAGEDRASLVDGNQDPASEPELPQLCSDNLVRNDVVFARADGGHLTTKGRRDKTESGNPNSVRWWPFG